MSKTDVYSYPPDKNSFFWHYLSDSQKGLIDEGFMLLDNTKKTPDERIVIIHTWFFLLPRLMKDF